MGIDTVVSNGLDLTFLASWTAPGQVRTLIEFRIAEWGLAHVADDAFLIAGELVANAVASTPDREIRIRFTRDSGAVLLAVWDASDAMPAARRVSELTLEDIAPDPEALDAGHDDGTGGWGLPIVDALSAECGVRATPPNGKWVWSRISI